MQTLRNPIPLLATLSIGLLGCPPDDDGPTTGADASGADASAGDASVGEDAGTRDATEDTTTDAAADSSTDVGPTPATFEDVAREWCRRLLQCEGYDGDSYENPAAELDACTDTIAEQLEYYTNEWAEYGEGCDTLYFAYLRCNTYDAACATRLDDDGEEYLDLVYDDCTDPLWSELEAQCATPESGE